MELSIDFHTYDWILICLHELSTIVALKHIDPSPITRVTKRQVQKAHAK